FASKPLSFSIDLFHRDSSLSPIYDPSSTLAQRAEKEAPPSMLRSCSIASRFSNTTSVISSPVMAGPDNPDSALRKVPGLGRGPPSLVKQIGSSIDDKFAYCLLELIDSLEHLGVAYHFESEVKRSLDAICTSTRGFEDLYSSSLRFRIPRQHGYNVSAELFSRFREQSGRFSENLREDVRGLLSLYEATQLACEGETVLEEAMAFSSHHLRARISRMDQRMSRQVQRALRWWRDLGLGDHICFARDRLVESYFMAVGKMHEPQFSQYRMQLARVSYLMATVEEIFGEHQWDLQAAEQLPQSLRVFYAAVYNTTNQISYTVLRRHGRDITSHMRRAVDGCMQSLLG
ncbi:alpha-thujene synthase TPS3, chloroplastic-like, partial [Nymphaea colorata]